VAETFEFSFTLPQIEALIRALENCGINSGSTASMLESFRDPTLISAARSAHGLLRSKGQRQARAKGGSEPIRELTKDSAQSDQREAYRLLKGDYLQLLTGIDDLLKASRKAHEALASRLAPERRPEETAALTQLTRVLERAWYSDSAMADRLAALENAKN
jgi:hypothetical protein